jgi:hypothetical protein
MTYNEALSQLDEPIEGKDYGNKMMVSKSNGEYILKSKYGLSYCTRDWPAPFTPTGKDLEATDYKIVTSTSEN